MLANHHVTILQTGSFNWGLKNYIDLVLCIIGYHWKDIKLYVFDPFHLQRATSFIEATQNLNIYLYNYQTETATFLATKHEKTIMVPIKLFKFSECLTYRYR